MISHHFRRSPVGLAVLFLVAVACAFGAPSWAKPAAPIILPADASVTDATRDGAGTIWAYSQNNGLCRYTPQGWVHVPVTGLSGDASGWGFALATDGAVYSGWSINEPGPGLPANLIVRAYGTSARALGKVPDYQTGPGSGSGPDLVAGARGDLWCLLGNRKLIRVDRTGVAFVKTLPDSLFVRDEFHPEDTRDHADLDAFPDSRGNMWFYTHGYIGWGLRLPGFLIWTGKTLVDHPSVPGLPGGRIDAAMPAGANMVWVFVRKAGLYAIDERSMTARSVTPAFPRGVDDIVAMARCGGNVYAENYGYHGAGRYETLWRLRGGKWTERLDGIDAFDTYSWGSAGRYCVHTASGCWIASVDKGFWFDPDNGGPITQVDWRRGVPAADGGSILPFSKGRLMIAYGPVQIIPDGLPPMKPDAGKWIVMPSANDPAVTTGGKVVFVEAVAGNTIEIWDGHDFKHVVYPRSIAAVYQSTCLVDDHDRYWPAPSDARQAAGYYDLDTGQWTVFKTFTEALVATYKQSGPWKLTELNRVEPSFDGKGGIVFQASNRIYYYDGSSWQSWDVRSIVPQSEDPDEWQGAPSFTDDGKPRIYVNGQAYCLDSGKWHTFDGQPVPLDFTPTFQNPQTPAGCITSNPDSFEHDASTDVYWLTYQKRLWRQYGTTCVPALPPGRVSPFDDGRRITSVFEDCAGNTWLGTNGTEYVLIPRSAPRTLAITVKHTAVDGVSITFSNAANTPLKYIWRVNGAPWSDPEPAGPHDLTLLPAGTYTVDVRSIDRYADPDPKPTSTTFTIDVDTASQIKGLIDQLTAGNDAQRNAALSALARQPKAALPVLNAALPDADTDEARWWINAAIQACQQAQDANTQP